MYIDDELFSWIESRCNKNNIDLTFDLLEDIVDNCGIWYSLEGIMYETEDFDLSLEDCFVDYWFVVDKDKIVFTNPDTFSENLDEYIEEII